MDKILVFIPAYNCEKQIVRVLGQFDEEVLKYISEIIVVNNRSTDNTEIVAADYLRDHPELPAKLLRNKENYGLGGSHKVAFDHAINNGFDYCIVLHGDDQGMIRDFLPVLESKYYRKHDCILGARFMNGSRLEGYSAFRTFGNVVYDFLFAAVVRKRIYDLGSGLNMYRVDMLRDRFYEKFPDNLMFNYCMILASDYFGHDIRFYPVSWREDDQVSNVKMMSQAVKVLKMLKEYYSDPEVITEDYRDVPIDSYEAETVINGQ
ncbi:MAG: glycosyltransferase family 2 protein [Lachnospiraceae bacterium]|nr:glycosyltransferase family 2 protein [Lachnospiraceae bacterium]